MAITLQEHLSAIADEAVACYETSDLAYLSSLVVWRLQEHPGTERLAQQGYMLHSVLSAGWSKGPQGLRMAIVGLADWLA